MNAMSHIDALATFRAKTSFISSVSHELRSPLHGILGANNFLADSELTRFQEEMVDSIRSCGHTLLDTLEHVMDFAKINSSPYYTSKRQNGSDRGNESEDDSAIQDKSSLSSTLDLSSLIEEVVDAVAMGFKVQNEFLYDDKKTKPDTFESGYTSASSRDKVSPKSMIIQRGEVRMALDLPSQLLAHVKTDPGAWRRILMNLFSNALKYTKTRIIVVHLEGIESAGEENRIKAVLTVTDTGRGISSDYLRNHLYRPFSQEDPLSVGTGLGLSIVSHMVRNMGGTIDVESSKGVGTTVRVSIEMSLIPTAPSILPPSDFDFPVVEQMRGMKICLLEDSTSRASKEVETVQRTSEARYSQILLQQVRDWFHVEASLPNTRDAGDADMGICLEPAFRHLITIREHLEGSKTVPTVIFIAYDALEMASVRTDARVLSTASVVEVLCQP